MNARWLWALTWVVPGLAGAQWSQFDARDHQVVDPFAVSACSDAASQEVRSRMPSANAVKVTKTDPSAAGEGTFAGVAGPSQTFTFQCTYDVKARTTSGVTVLL
jgi:hypothetical protein